MLTAEEQDPARGEAAEPPCSDSPDGRGSRDGSGGLGGTPRTVLSPIYFAPHLS